MKFPIAAGCWIRQLANLRLNSPHIYAQARFISNDPSKSATDPCKLDPEDPWAAIQPVSHAQPKRVSLDEFPLPQGSWQESFDRRKRLGSIQLGLGVLFFGGTVFYLWYKDPLDFEKVLGPRKFMNNPPAFESPILEPSIFRDIDYKPEDYAASTPKLLPKYEVEKSHSAIDPNRIPDIPNHVPFLIVGGGTAAFSAFRAIRANNPNASVLVVTDESHYPYMRPPLSKELWYADEAHRKGLRFKPWSGKERSVFFEHEEFYMEPKMLPFVENGGVAVLRNMTVTSLNPRENRLTLRNGWEIYYDRLLLAPGGKPRTLPCFENASRDVMKHVTVYRGVDDFRKLDAATKSAKKVVIIGGGFLGSELACSLAHRGKTTGMEIHQIYPEKGNLGRVLPEYLSEWTTKKIVNVDKVKVYPGRFVTKARYANDQVIVQLNDNQEIAADHVVVAVGIAPNTDLASSSGLEVDETLGGFKVNAELQAADNIWVAGDAASFFDVTLGRRRMEHHDHAVATGRIAGENMLGSKKPFWHQSMFWSDLGPEIGFEAVGLVDSSLDTVAVFAQNNFLPDEIKHTTGEKIPLDGSTSKHEVLDDFPVFKIPDPNEDYSKGIIYYLKDRLIVGILLWNVFNHVSIARKVIKDQKSFDDLAELAKLFSLHDEEREDGDEKKAEEQ